MRESEIEKACTEYARKQGWHTFKLAGPGDRGKPDRLYYRDGRTLFVEYKTSKGRLSALQERTLRRLRESGMDAFVIRSVEEACRVF